MNAIRKLEDSLTSAIRLEIPSLIQVGSMIMRSLSVLALSKVNQSIRVLKRCLGFSEEQFGSEVSLPKVLFDIVDCIILEMHVSIEISLLRVSKKSFDSLSSLFDVYIFMHPSLI